nr:hypothetical protein [Paraburkholderia tropica]
MAVLTIRDFQPAFGQTALIRITASVLVDDSAPAATFVSLTFELAPTPPSVTELCDDESYSTASASLPLRLVIWPCSVVTEPCRLLMLVVFAVTCVLVAYNCEPFTASVLVADTRPAATFVTWRSAPAAPTLTTPVGVAPAYVNV